MATSTVKNTAYGYSISGGIDTTSVTTGNLWVKEFAYIPNANNNYVRMYNAGNILVDGSLETWTDANTLTNWTKTGTNSTLDRETTEIKTGTYSALLTRVGVDCYLSQSISLGYAGTTLYLRGGVYATAADRAKLIIVDSAGNTASSYHTGGSTWELLTVEREIASNVTSLSVRLQVDTGNTAAYFDGNSLFSSKNNLYQIVGATAAHSYKAYFGKAGCNFNNLNVIFNDASDILNITIR